MKKQVMNRTYLALILATVIIVWGTPGISYAQKITLVARQPFTEANLHEGVLTLRLTGINFDRSIWDITDAITVSGIDGVSIGRWGIERVSNTMVTIELTYNGNMDADGTLVVTVENEAIQGYNGNPINLSLNVLSVEESLVASTASPLAETTLHESVITLALSGRKFEDEWDIRNATAISGIEGVTLDKTDVDRVSDTRVTVQLTFCGDFDTDATLTLNMGADAIAGYNQDFTVEIPVTATDEPQTEKSLVASTTTPLTEALMHEGIVTLTLTGATYEPQIRDDNLTVTGIDGVTLDSTEVQRISDTDATIKLSYDGNMNTDGTLTFTLHPCSIVGYNEEPLTAQLTVPAVQESLVASTEITLTELTLDSTIVTLTLTGRNFDESAGQISWALSVSGIDGITFDSPYISSDYTPNVERVSDTEVTLQLKYDQDFDTDATLTFTLEDRGIEAYTGQELTAQISVTAIKQSNATVSISPSQLILQSIDDQQTFSLNITNGENIAGYQATVSYDNPAFHYVTSDNGDYLPDDTFFVRPDEEYWIDDVSLSSISYSGAGNGDGTLATITLKVNEYTESTLRLSNVYLIDSDGTLWEVATENAQVILPLAPQDIVFGDINRDGVVNILDLVIVYSRFSDTHKTDGETERVKEDDIADVNGDGSVDIIDLVLVAGAFTEETAAPSVKAQVIKLLTPADVKGWLTQAQQLGLTDPKSLQGIFFLQQLLATLTPKKTALLPNYPNPFNPETWIPYQLSKDAHVTVRIYSVDGSLVRTIAIGNQAAGIYQTRSRAAYWDGKNDFGEHVASGVYFYTLTAGDFSATRKMLIRK